MDIQNGNASLDYVKTEVVVILQLERDGKQTEADSMRHALYVRVLDSVARRCDDLQVLAKAALRGDCVKPVLVDMKSAKARADDLVRLHLEGPPDEGRQKEFDLYRDAVHTIALDQCLEPSTLAELVLKPRERRFGYRF